jgi:hypothetical protein
MAGRKAKKKAKIVAAVSSKAECMSCSDPSADIPDWLLLIIGAFGFVTAVGWLNWPFLKSYEFSIAWPIIVIVVAAWNLMKRKSGCC